MTVSNISSAANTQPTPANDGFNQLFTDFKGIGSAIQSGDLTSAQTALTSFQTDLQNNPGKNPLSQLFKKNSRLGDDLTALQTALKSNDPASAQNAFQTLIQDMKGAMRAHRSHGHHHHHHHVDHDGDSDDGAKSPATAAPAANPTPGSLSVTRTLFVQA